MGGKSTQTQQSSTTGAQTQSSTGAQTQQTRPWEATSGQLQSLLANIGGISPSLTGAETGALDRLVGFGQAGNRFAPAIGGVANTLLGGGGPDRTGIAQDAYNRFLSETAPTAGGDFLDPSKNPFFMATTGAIGSDVEDRLRSLYAGAGRAPSGAGGDYVKQLAEGISRGTAPVYSDVFNRERDRQLGAITGRFGAGGTTTSLLSGLDQARLGNMLSGVGAAGAANEAEMFGPMAVLQAEAQRRGIPLQVLAQQYGLTVPLAQAFGTTSGTTSGTASGTSTGTQTGTAEKQMSGAEQFALLAGGLGSLFGGRR